MADLLKNKNLPFLIIDCRFDYEYKGGHIKSALNINTPEDIEDYFFKD